jgi:5-methyltetrahydrofolate--homocysteine methyltransferase
MKTMVRSVQGKEIIIGDRLPTVLIGERVNPFGKSGIKEALAAGNTELVKAEAARQVAAGADILNVSVNAFGIDERVMLPRVVMEMTGEVDVPFCLESRNPEALEAVLQNGCGTPIINSVTGEDAILDVLLPLVKRYNTAVVALATDSAGIPSQPQRRLEVLRKIVDRAEQMGIGRERIIADCLAESIGINPGAAETTLETMRIVKEDLGLNLVLGASNISFGLPRRSFINTVFLSLAVRAGLDSAIVNVEAVKPYILAADLLTGRDARARRYSTYFRTSKTGKA